MIPGEKRGRGRPATGIAKSSTERAREKRQRDEEKIIALVEAAKNKTTLELADEAGRGTKDAWLVIGRRFEWL